MGIYLNLLKNFCTNFRNFVIFSNEIFANFFFTFFFSFRCGPGTFIFDLSSSYPSSTFIGVDFASIFPTQVPRNTSFVVANIMDGLPFEDCTFDYIHARFLVMYFTQDEWENVVIKELTRVLKPGGYLECYDSEIPWYNMSPSLEKLSDAGTK